MLHLSLCTDAWWQVDGLAFSHTPCLSKHREMSQNLHISLYVVCVQGREGPFIMQVGFNQSRSIYQNPTRVFPLPPLLLYTDSVPTPSYPV